MAGPASLSSIGVTVIWTGGESGEGGNRIVRLMTQGSELISIDLSVPGSRRFTLTKREAESFTVEFNEEGPIQVERPGGIREDKDYILKVSAAKAELVSGKEDRQAGFAVGAHQFEALYKLEARLEHPIDTDEMYAPGDNEGAVLLTGALAHIQAMAAALPQTLLSPDELAAARVARSNRAHGLLNLLEGTGEEDEEEIDEATAKQLVVDMNALLEEMMDYGDDTPEVAMLKEVLQEVLKAAEDS